MANRTRGGLSWIPRCLCRPWSSSGSVLCMHASVRHALGDFRGRTVRRLERRHPSGHGRFSIVCLNLAHRCVEYIQPSRFCIGRRRSFGTFLDEMEAIIEADEVSGMQREMSCTAITRQRAALFSRNCLDRGVSMDARNINLSPQSRPCSTLCCTAGAERTRLGQQWPRGRT